ncbi:MULTISPECIES: pseudaminic acid synthase [Mesorhizobium]|uniref:pseudaminic acid synthase n=1 Tax=Mesorhizobium TaxID=68287 RepID=UPI0027E198E4|nr:pseudaminic acid synthase [Mesorhizobium sp. LHD-90]MDQ6437587.1 pseudaminic acid synthase [Mesorhizobium sp. LHD-90]
MARLKELLFAGTERANDQSPFIIAEMSGNHNASLDKALAIVDAAAASGADALKLQTYTPDTMTLDVKEGEFVINNPSSLWAGRDLYNLYKEAHTPWEWHKPIFDRAKSHGMLAFSSAFDDTSVDFLETLDVPCYKVASFECVDIPLIKKVASTGKPMIISTGMATIAEIDDAVTAARGAGCKHLVLLKCTSSYPASPENSNLRTIPHLAKLFDCEAGLSDHTLGIGAAVAATALGAGVIEKHFIMSRAEGGVDSAFSLEPQEFTALVDGVKVAQAALGSIFYGATESEQKGRTRRRSLYVTKDIEAGGEISADNIRSIRPGLGLAPKFYDTLLGRRVSKPVKKGTPVSWDLLG